MYNIYMQMFAPTYGYFTHVGKLTAYKQVEETNHRTQIQRIAILRVQSRIRG